MNPQQKETRRRIILIIILVTFTIGYLTSYIGGGYNRELKEAESYKSLALETLNRIKTDKTPQEAIGVFCYQVVDDYLTGSGTFASVLEHTADSTDQYDILRICTSTIYTDKAPDRYDLEAFKTVLLQISGINYGVFDYIRFAGSNYLTYSYVISFLIIILSFRTRFARKSYKYVKTAEIPELIDNQLVLMKKLFKFILVTLPVILTVITLSRATSLFNLSYFVDFYLPIFISIPLIIIFWRKIDRFQYKALNSQPLKAIKAKEYIDENELAELLRKMVNYKEHFKLVFYGLSTSIFIIIWVFFSIGILLFNVANI